MATGGMAMAQEERVPAVVRAERFEVVQGADHVRASLGVDEGDSVSLTLRGEDKFPQLRMSVHPENGAYLSLWGKHDRDLMMFSAEAGRGTAVTMSGVVSTRRRAASISAASRTIP